MSFFDQCGYSFISFIALLIDFLYIFCFLFHWFLLSLFSIFLFWNSFALLSLVSYGESLRNWFEPFLKKKKRYFSATNFEMFYFHFHSVRSTLKLPFWFLPWPKSYCEICHLIIKYLMDSSRYVSVTDFPFNFIVVREPILYDLNPQSIEIYFMAQNMVSLGKCTQCTWKLCEFYYCWAEGSINAN